MYDKLLKSRQSFRITLYLIFHFRGTFFRFSTEQSSAAEISRGYTKARKTRDVGRKGFRFWQTGKLTVSYALRERPPIAPHGAAWGSAMAFVTTCNVITPIESVMSRITHASSMPNARCRPTKDKPARHSQFYWFFFFAQWYKRPTSQ